MSIPESVIEEVKNRTSIVDIVSEFIQLRRSGQGHMGLCPFHSENTPSFSVRDEHGTFHCFGCGKRGNVFTLLMELRGLTFPEAVRSLAAKVGVEVPDERRSNDSKQTEEAKRRKNLMKLLLECATEIFQNNLLHAPEAVGYLTERKISQATLERYRLGYAANTWDFIRNAIFERVKTISGITITDEEALTLIEECGLIKKREVEREGRSDFYDVFRGRVLFPIQRSDGATIAFGGRILPALQDSRSPKYLNSCESVLYSKRQTLFGLPQAIPSMRKNREAYLVEGYMDVLGFSQAGIPSVLATCGTAVTEQHSMLLRRFVERVVILFDGDSAGKKAAAQCFEVFLNSGMDCFVVNLPEGDDPDTFAGRQSLEETSEFLKANQRPLFDFYLDYLLGEIPDGTEMSATLRGKTAEKIVNILSKVRNSVEREFLLRKAAERLGSTVASLEQLIGNRSVSPRPNTVNSRDVPARKKAAASSREGKDVMKRYYHQLLLAVISEPSLSLELLRVEEEIQVSRGKLMPEKLKSLLLAVGRELGIHESENWESPFASEMSKDRLRALLDDHGFAGSRVIEQAEEQMKGQKELAQAFVHSAAEVGVRQSLRYEIEHLRLQQETADSQYLLKIVQEKLEKKRSLDRVGKR